MLGPYKLQYNVRVRENTRKIIVFIKMRGKMLWRLEKW
jgi:hypothetical protein